MVRRGVKVWGSQEFQSDTKSALSPTVGSDTPRPLNFQPQTSQFPGLAGESDPGKCPIFRATLCLWFMDSLTVQPEIPHSSQTVILQMPQ